MIDIVRRTVLAILNKENNGYITPDEFNLYARQAQTEIFEQRFFDMNLHNMKLNARQMFSGDGNMAKRDQEVINIFRQQIVSNYNGTTGRFEIPEDCFFLGTITKNDFITEIVKVEHDKLPYALGSMDSGPNESYPIYAKFGNEISVYPTTINTSGDVLINYLRYPLDPKWTYTTVGESPLFNPSSASYQDFELPKDDETNLIIKILLYAGVEIRDPQVVQVAKTEEIQEKQEQK